MSCKSNLQSNCITNSDVDSVSNVAPSSDQDQYNQVSTAKTSLDEADWIQEIISASGKDTRKQPWKSTFVIPLNSRFDSGQDIVTVKKSGGGTPDPLCPFNTQGSSLAA